METLKEEIKLRVIIKIVIVKLHLHKAEDAIYLDMTGLSILEVVEKLNQKHKNICKDYKNDELNFGLSFFYHDLSVSLFLRYNSCC